MFNTFFFQNNDISEQKVLLMLDFKQTDNLRKKNIIDKREFQYNNLN